MKPRKPRDTVDGHIHWSESGVPYVNLETHLYITPSEALRLARWLIAFAAWAEGGKK